MVIASHEASLVAEGRIWMAGAGFSLLQPGAETVCSELTVRKWPDGPSLLPEER